MLPEKKLLTEILAVPPVERLIIICGNRELGKMCSKVVLIASLLTESNAAAISRKSTAADG